MDYRRCDTSKLAAPVKRVMEDKIVRFVADQDWLYPGPGAERRRWEGSIGSSCSSLQLL